MTDFFDNLLVRSLAGQSPESLLQPHLPSLFERPYGAEVLSTPMADSIAQQGFAASAQVSAVTASESDLSANPTTLRKGSLESEAVEPVIDQPAISHAESPPPPEPHQQGSLRSTIQSIPTVKPFTNTQQELPVSIPDEPASTIMPRAKSQAVGRKAPSVQENRPAASQEREQPSHLEPVSLPRKEAEERQRPNELRSTVMPRAESRTADRQVFLMQENRESSSREQGQLSHLRPASVYIQKETKKSQPPAEDVQIPLQAEIRLIKKDPAVEETAHPRLEALPDHGSLKQPTVLQPILDTSRTVETQQLEPSKGQDTQRIVEIYIGRIEVRAVPASNSQKQPSPTAKVLSLDDYLRSRSGGKP